MSMSSRPFLPCGYISPKRPTQPPSVSSRSTRTTWRPMSARPIAARRPVIPPPMTSVLGVVSTTIGSSGVESRVRAIPARTRPMALSVAASSSSRVDPRALLADVDLGVLVRVHAAPGGDAPERVGVELRGAGGHDEAVEAELLDVLGDLLLAGLGAGEHGRPGDDHGLLAERLGGDPLDVDVVGDVAAAVADVDADFPPAWAIRAGASESVIPARRSAHAGTSTFSRRARSRWAETCATVAPACRIDSAMSFAPEAAPAT